MLSQASPDFEGGRLYSLEKAADALDVNERTVRRMIAAGQLPAYRMGRRAIRIREADLFGVLHPIPTSYAS